MQIPSPLETITRDAVELAPGEHRGHDRVQEVSISGASGNWHDKTPMNIRRTCLNAVILPTREVFLSGGTAADPVTYGTLGLASSTHVGQDANGFWQPVFLSEIYDPGTSATAPGSTRYAALPNPNPVLADEDAGPGDLVNPLLPWTPRLFHQVTILLPDGSVLIAGGGDVDFDEVAFGFFLAKASQTAEIYYPPYYFEPRSRITLASSSTTFDSGFKVTVESLPVGHVVEQFVLIKSETVTHHFDSDQRYIELEHVPVSCVAPGCQTQIVIAPSKSLGPAGSYLLFAISTDGTARIPSQGVFIDLK